MFRRVFHRDFFGPQGNLTQKKTPPEKNREKKNQKGREGQEKEVWEYWNWSLISLSKVCPLLLISTCKIKHAGSWKVLIAAISKLFRARPHLPLPPPRFFPVRFSCFDDQIIISVPPRKGDSLNYFFNWSIRDLPRTVFSTGRERTRHPNKEQNNHYTLF